MNTMNTPQQSRLRWIVALLVVLAIAALGCVMGQRSADDDPPTNQQTNQQRTGPDQILVVPPEAAMAPSYLNDGRIPPQRYVVRMSDGARDWEVEFPATARGYEVRIPLGDNDRPTPGYQALSPADRELIEHLRRTDPDFERSGTFIDGEHSTDVQARRDGDAGAGENDRPRDEASPAPSRPSYLGGIDEVQRLFQAGQYEMALNQLSHLETAYPNDVRLKSMKGTLWLRIGRESLARQAWEEVLQIDPQNRPVQEALRRLDGVPAENEPQAD